MLSNHITLEDKPLFDGYFKSFSYEISNFNFTNLFMWRNYSEFTYEIIQDFLCISGRYCGKPFLFAPVAKGSYDPQKLSSTIDILKNRFDEGGYPFSMKVLPAHLITTFQQSKPHELIFLSDSSNYDYVYLVEDLITLKGRKLHGKKNHWNYFMKNIDHQYVPLTPDLIDQCISLTRRIRDDNETPSDKMLLDSEEAGIFEALTHMEELGLVGGAILIDDKVEAFTFGEQLNRNTVLAHIEKANANIRGLYQAINQQFVKREWSHMKYVNREEDMGFESLRKAKKSYNPVKMIKKYDVTFV